MKKRYTLGYGTKKVSFGIEEERVIDILDVEEIPAIQDLEGALRTALANPIGTKAFNKLFQKGDKVCILVSDITRVPTAKLCLPELLRELNSLGVDDKDIRIVISTGAHRGHSKSEHRTLVGDEVYERVEVRDHDCYDSNALKYVGTTSRGTEVYLNRKALEVDRLILTGEITFHYFAGYCGGRKSILPGISSFEAIQTNHKLCMHPAKGSLPTMASAGIYELNPVNEDMIEAAGMVSPAFLINVVLNKEKQIARFFAGDPVEAHREGCKFIDGTFRPSISQEADLVVVSAGGWPSDINFIQTHKAMDNASFTLKESGVMVLLGECSEGFGSKKLEEYFKLGSLDLIEKSLKEDFTIPGHTVYAALSKAKRFKIIFVSSFSDEAVEGMSMIPAKSIEKALKKAYRILPKDFTSFIMPNGSVTLPK